jgi:hypothetical protein
MHVSVRLCVDARVWVCEEVCMCGRMRGSVSVPRAAVFWVTSKLPHYVWAHDIKACVWAGVRAMLMRVSRLVSWGEGGGRVCACACCVYACQRLAVGKDT